MSKQLLNTRQSQGYLSGGSTKNVLNGPRPFMHLAIGHSPFCENLCKTSFWHKTLRKEIQ